MSIDINREAVRGQGVVCGTAAETVGPAARKLENGYVPNTELMCKSAWITCQGVWYSTFTQLTEALTSTGGKLQTVANLVGATDDVLEGQFRSVVATEPDAGSPGSRRYP